MIIFQPLKVVGRGSQKQLEVDENCHYLAQRLMGLPGFRWIIPHLSIIYIFSALFYSTTLKKRKKLLSI